MRHNSILLTSIGLSAKPALDYVRGLCERGQQVVSVIVTASEGKSENKYVKLAKEQFESLGAIVTFVDLEIGENLPTNTTIVYVSGGNTFTLMKYINESSFKNQVERVINEKGGCYIGVSAGAIVAGSTIKSAFILGDKNNIGIKDFSGMGLVNYSVFPHSDEEMKREVLCCEEYENPIFINNDDFVALDIYSGNTTN